MLFIYHMLCEAPTQYNTKSYGLIVPLNFTVNIIKTIIEMVAVFIIIDICSGGLIEDEALEEALANFFRICLQVIIPLSVTVLSAMIYTEVLIPNGYTEDDRVLF